MLTPYCEPLASFIGVSPQHNYHQADQLIIVGGISWQTDPPRMNQPRLVKLGLTLGMEKYWISENTPELNNLQHLLAISQSELQLFKLHQQAILLKPIMWTVNNHYYLTGMSPA